MTRGTGMPYAKVAGDGVCDFGGQGEDDGEREGAGEVAVTRDGTVCPRADS
jgi:hypothetical protein